MATINYLWLLTISAIFIGYTIRLRGAPEEALHFVQYGALGFLGYWALRHRLKDVSVYFGAAVIGAIVGTLDEALQWITPDRYWGFDDIWLDFAGAALVQIAISKGIRPTTVAGAPSPSSIRFVCRLAALALVLLGASLLNTPARVAWCTEHIPFLGFLKENSTAMVEYGYRYVDPEIGTFYSRLQPHELAQSDENRGKEVAQILDNFGGDRSKLSRFLERYTSFGNPFVHEALVHIFRREVYLEASTQEEPEEDLRFLVTVAYRENQIMEKYFAKTLHTSTLVMRAEEVDRLRPHLWLDNPYYSAVSSNIISRFSEAQIVAIFALALLGLIFIHSYYGRKIRVG